MIDLHSHILPGLCDGSQDLDTSLAMARMAVTDGTTHLACTPHIYPPLYNNHTAGITSALEKLQVELDKHNIPLCLVIGADVHMTLEVMQGLKQGTIPTLNSSRYFLLEPSHHVPVNNFLGQVENFLNAGFVPVITHPERLHWVGKKYAEFAEAARMGAWLQITADSITGRFGKTAQQFSERFLRDGYVHIIASDAHGTRMRPPTPAAGVKAAAEILVNAEEALRMAVERPRAILDDNPPESVTPALAFQPTQPPRVSSPLKSWLARLFG